MTAITADMIKTLLAAKHSEDIFVPECKTGPTIAASSCPRLDAWAMNRSWTRHCTTGYEIKVSRQDFLNDVKWRAYLDYCHCFYFVCPPKLIDPKELPEGVGLMVTSTNCKRLYTKRTAPHREVTIPTELFIYILMSRCRITRSQMDTAAYWKEFVDGRANMKKWGHQAAYIIAEKVDQQVKEIKGENAKLRAENESLAEIKRWAESQDIRLGSWTMHRDLEARLEEHRTGLSADTVSQLQSLKHTAEQLLAKLEGR